MPLTKVRGASSSNGVLTLVGQQLIIDEMRGWQI
jgi:hypothetical protein